MPEDVIKARIVFDTGGLTGGAGSFGGGGKGVAAGGAAGGGIGVLKLAKGVALGNLLTKGLVGLSKKLVDASPRLQNSLNILNKSIMMFLRPIADTIGLVLRPFAFAMLKWAIGFYKWWLQGGGKNLNDALAKRPEERTQDEEALVRRAQAAVTIGGGAVAGGTIGGPAGAGIGALVGAIPTIIGSIKLMFFEIIPSWMDSFLKFFGVDLKAVVGKIYEFILLIGQGLENVKFVFDNFSNIVWFWWGELKEFVVNEVLLPIIEAWGTLKTFVIDDFIAPVTEAWDSLKKFIEEKFISPIKESWTKFKDWIDTDIIKPIKDYWIAFVTWVSTDVISPIQSAWEGLVSAAASAINNAIASVKSVFGFGGGREDRVNDAIITKTGRVIRTNPNDTIIATQNPGGIGGGGTTITKHWTRQV